MDEDYELSLAVCTLTDVRRKTARWFTCYVQVSWYVVFTDVVCSSSDQKGLSASSGMTSTAQLSTCCALIRILRTPYESVYIYSHSVPIFHWIKDGFFFSGESSWTAPLYDYTDLDEPLLASAADP
jgi:hypothetical protein